MRISITRTELTMLATSLITLIALALAPAWWGAAFGQGATLNSVAQTRELQGTVSVTNEAGERLPGASLSLTSTSAAQAARSTVTNDQGEYKFTDLAAGVYTLQVSLNGFKEHTETITIGAVATTTKDIALEVADVSATVTVVADGDGLSSSDTAPTVSFNQNKLETLPLVNERFQDAIPLVPGVVRGPDGMLNLKGARSSQSGMIVNSANVTDPVTGESSINLPIEAVQSVEVLTNPYSAEYGQFTGAVTSVQTRSGSDKFHANATSFFPRPRRRGGSLMGVEAFTPRVTFSGPLMKDKLKFFQSFEYRYVRTPVENLPPLSRDTDLESFDSLSQLDWDIDDKNHLTTTLSLFPEKLRYVGLNTFNHQEVTPNFKQRGFLLAINERRIVNSKSVLESSFSLKQFDADVFPSSGSAPMNFAPDGNSGNFFNRQARQSKRYQALETYSFEGPNFAGTHLMKVGGGVSYETFDGRNTSNAVRILRADGTRSQQFDYEGGGRLSRNKTQFLAYFEDKWTLNRRLTLEYGVRYDRDNVAGENNISPRIGFAFLPLVDGRTVVRGGIGIFYDDINLNVATFSQLQDRIAKNCLQKDPLLRLRFVSWKDFHVNDELTDCIESTKDRIRKRQGLYADTNKRIEPNPQHSGRLERRISETIRTKLEDLVRQEFIRSELFLPIEIQEFAGDQPHKLGFLVFLKASQQLGLSYSVSLVFRVELIDAESQAVTVGFSAAVSDVTPERDVISSSPCAKVFEGVFQESAIPSLIERLIYPVLEEAQQIDRNTSGLSDNRVKWLTLPAGDGSNE